MAEQTLEEMLGGRIKYRSEGTRGWVLDNYHRPFSNKLYAAATAMMLDDAERTGKDYFSKQDFKVYVLNLIVANNSAEFFEEEGISNSEDKMPLADEISTVKTQLTNTVARHSELRGEKLKEVIILNVLSIEKRGGPQLGLAGGTIAELAKQAFNYVLSRNEQPHLDYQDRKKDIRGGYGYKLVK